MILEHLANLSIIQEKEDLERDSTSKHDRNEQGFEHRVVIVRQSPGMQGETSGSNGDHDEIQGIPEGYTNQHDKPGECNGQDKVDHPHTAAGRCCSGDQFLFPAFSAVEPEQGEPGLPVQRHPECNDPDPPHPVRERSPEQERMRGCVKGSYHGKARAGPAGHCFKNCVRVGHPQTEYERQCPDERNR